jgi:hypothetical protein
VLVLEIFTKIQLAWYQAKSETKFRLCGKYDLEAAKTSFALTGRPAPIEVRFVHGYYYFIHCCFLLLVLSRIGASGAAFARGFVVVICSYLCKSG